MKKLAILVLVVFLMGCETPRQQHERENRELNEGDGRVKAVWSFKVNGYTFNVITIDNKEYIQYRGKLTKLQ